VKLNSFVFFVSAYMKKKESNQYVVFQDSFTELRETAVLSQLVEDKSRDLSVNEMNKKLGS